MNSTQQLTSNDHSYKRRFSGIARLYGSDALTRFSLARVCVVGVGGVGSWVVEALARSGIGHLILIDLDHIAESNINRQIQALDPDLGKAKVTALAERIANINALATVTAVSAFAELNTLDKLIDPNWDWVVDCIDNSRNKADLVAHCHRLGLQFVSSGGAGGRRNPTCIRVADLSQTQHDALLTKVRTRLRREYGFPRLPQQEFGIPCVYSDEIPSAIKVQIPKHQIATVPSVGSGLNCSGYGSVVTVTATFGFIIASLVLNQLADSVK